jgi:Sulfotransferase domain
LKALPASVRPNAASPDNGPEPLGILVSFPKSGRTWLRVMLDYLELPLEYSHADSGHQKRIRYDKLDARPERFAKQQVILLIRDPRDVVVSGYFQATRRKNIYSGDISQFVRDPYHGIEKIIHFTNVWLAAAEAMTNILVVRYEDCHANTAQQVKRIAEALGHPDLPEERISAAVEFGRFENMQEKEARGEFAERYGAALQAKASEDTESFKTRRGKVAGYTDYLSAADIEYCNDVMRRHGSEYL